MKNPRKHYPRSLFAAGTAGDTPNGFSLKAMFRKSATQRLCLTACAAAAIPALTLVQSARGADVTWTGTTNMTWIQPDTTSWSATYNSGDNVTFTSAGAGTVTVSGTVNPGNFSLTSGTTYAFTGGGTLSANGTSFQVGPPGTAVNVTASMSALSNLVYNNSAGTFRAGLFPTFNLTSPQTTTLTLAANNTITAANFFVGDQQGGTAANVSTSLLRLGVSNVINVNNINVGYSGRSTATLDFAGASSSVTFRGADGSSAVGLWLVGNVVTNGQTAYTANVNFSNGTIDALVTELTIGCADIGGQTSRQGNETATFTMGNGTMTVTDLNIGRISNVGGLGTLAGNLAANGTFTLNNATGVLKAGTINLTTNTITANTNTRTVNGTFNLTNGTLEATTIQKGAQTGTATATAAFNFTAGTLRNAVGSNLNINNVPINLTGSGTRFIEATTGRSVIVGSTGAVISGSGQGFTKTGDGTLILQATNTYSGATNVNAGTLIVNGNISTSSLTTVAIGATLGGSGTVGAALINGTLAVGNSPGQMNFTDTLVLTGATIMEIDGNSGAGVTGGHDFINLTGVGPAGVLTYGGTMTLDMGVLFGIGSYNWNLFDMADETGTFTSITLADQYSGSLLDGDMNGVWDLTSGSNTWVFSESTGVLGLTVIPEPSVALISSLGLLALCAVAGVENRVFAWPARSNLVQYFIIFMGSHIVCGAAS